MNQVDTSIDTGKVTGRRQVHFNNLDDVLADATALAASGNVKTLGNWSAGQIFEHLARTYNLSIDGFPPVMPGFVRFLLRLFMKRRFLRKPMPPGFKLPAKAEALLPPPIGLQEGFAHLSDAVQRLKTTATRMPNPVVGRLSREEWDQLHCRHAELHLSFIVPVSG